MSSADDLEKQIQKHALAINELSIRIENLNRHAEDLFKELNVTSEQISAFVGNKEHFTEENWETLLEQNHKLEEKLKRELDNIRNPKKVKNSLSDMRVQPHWLFVR